jgi:glycosyltransferase involved in cell wall biosynthesis
MAAGRPVVAYRAGGALDTVNAGQTGIFFDQQTPEALMSALHELANHHWDTHIIRTHAESFGRDRFMQRIRDFMATVTCEVTP